MKGRSIITIFLFLTLSSAAFPQQAAAQDSAVAAPAAASPARMVFTHKCNSIYDCQMSLKKMEGMYKLMPRKLKREIGQVYYPALRDGLQGADEIKYLEADARKQMLDDGTMLIELSFPKFFLTMEHITWEDLDRLFLTYFKDKS